MAVYDGDRLSGTSLIGIFGDDRLNGKRMRQARSVGKTMLRYSAPGLAYRGARNLMRMRGDDLELLGKKAKRKAAKKATARKPAAKKPAAKKRGGFMTAIRKVGKVTSGFTSGAAQMIGVPKSALNAFAKLDPTKKGQTVKKATKAVLTKPTTKTVVPVKASAMNIDMKKVAIIGGAGVGALVLVKVLTSRRG